MFVGRPRGPVARFDERHSSQNAAGLHVLAEQDIQSPPAAGAAGLKMKAGVALDFGERDKLQGIIAGYRRRYLGEVTAARSRKYLYVAVARYVEGIVGRH